MNFLNIGEAGYIAAAVAVVRGAGIARIRSVKTLVESPENLGKLEGGHIEEAALDVGGWKTKGREVRDDAEFVGAAFECSSEVRVG